MDDKQCDKIFTRLRQQAESLIKAESIYHQEENTLHKMQSLLHELQVHQIELELQNRELMETQEILAIAEEKYRNLFDFAPVGYCVLDSKGIVLELNHSLTELCDCQRNFLANYPLSRFIDESDILKWHRMLKTKEQEIEHNLLFIDGKKRQHFTQVRLQRLANHHQTNAEWLAAITDVTELHNLGVELKIKGAAVENTLEGVIITNARQEIRYVNPAFESTTGYSRDEVLGRNPKLLQSGKHTPGFYKEMWDSLRQNGTWQGEIWNRRATGEVYPEWLSITTIRDAKNLPSYFVGVFSDITKDEKVRQRLYQLAYFDGVTELPNRHLFMDRLEQQIKHARRDQSSFALMFLDLDRFKSINDTMGHSIGDLLLSQVSNRLRELVRSVDTVARMGGDEFTVLLPGSNSPLCSKRVANKILDCMATPFDLDGRQYHISVSIGISRYPEDGSDCETLIKNADIAMYHAKANGRNTFHFFDSGLTHKIHDQVHLESDLREALNQNHLELHYQPQKDLQTGEWVGVEALLRWNHPNHGMIPPSEFVKIAEESGLIVNIGYWVLQRAITQFLEWQETGIDVGVLSINLSPHQFLQNNLIERVESLLKETGMPAERLGLEVTESAAMPNFQYSIKTLESLRELGTRVYIDDFGTGFSSLSQLRRLPIDVLKIDRQFVSDIPHNNDGVAIAQAIVAMAKALRYRIVAEGIETEEQFAFLRALGCDTGQGYHFSRPVPSFQINEIFAA